MFIKKSSPKTEEATVSEILYKCTICGLPFIPSCKTGCRVCHAYCPACSKKIRDKKNS